jgi:hypothetical protein
MLFINWLQNHLLPCPFKYLTGIDCPGCGFQRSVLALIKGNLAQSFTFYPPTIPLLLFFGYLMFGKYLKLDNDRFNLKKYLFWGVSIIVLVSYGYKLLGIYHNYNTSIAAAM